jgi:hypothetical protein
MQRSFQTGCQWGMKKISVFTATLVALFFTACTKDNEQDDKTVNDNLISSWQWVRTDGGVGDNIHETPASTGTSVVLIFTADHTFYEHANGTFRQAGTYKIEKQKCIHDHTMKSVIVTTPAAPSTMMIEYLRNDSLVLSDESADGVSSLYIRNW